MRARASSPRLVSWVAVAVSPPALFRRAAAAGRWNSSSGSAARRRIAADLVEREQPVVAVEGGVLHRLGHQRAGELLQLEREIAHARRAVAGFAGEIERDGVAQKVENLRIRARASARGRARWRFDGLRGLRSEAPAAVT